MVQVFANLQPLNLCLTYQGTANVIKKLSENYDAEAKEWASTLESTMEKPSQPVRILITICTRFA